MPTYNISAPVVDIQEVHVLREEMGLRFPDLAIIKPPYPETLAFYSPERNLVLLSVIKDNDSTVEVDSFFSTYKNPFAHFLTARFPMNLSREPDTAFKLWHDPSITYETASANLGQVLFALNLMNCKNIRYLPVDPNERLNRRGKPIRNTNSAAPYLKYETLEIQPMKPRTVTKYPPLPVRATEQPLHTVRGHFKTFTSDNPLFGKLTGTYWWGPCVKGNPNIGVIEKDYRLRIKPSELNEILQAARGDSL